MANVGVVEMDVAFNDAKIARDLSKSVGAAAVPAASAVSKTLTDRLGVAGKATEDFGKSFSTNVSLPLAGIGAVAVKGFTDYDRTLSRISGLNGVAADQLQSLSAGAKQIGTDFGVGAQDAVDALYFITSSGFEGAAALDVLRESAKGSAIGLGDTQTVADLTTSALNAYKDSGLTAAQVTDQLTAAVRAGKAEPTELAGALGRVLPVASNLGVTFDEVAGATAAMSLTGSDAAEATTQLRGILGALVKPSKQAEEALSSVGLSSAGLRQQIKDEGLLPTLQTLTDHLGGNAEAAALVFEDVRALTGIMSILGENTDRTRGIIDDVTNSLGLSGEAMGKVADTDAFRLQKKAEEARTAIIDLGASLAPVATTMAGAFATAANAAAGLPEPVKDVGAAIGGIAVVAGPAIYGLGKVMQGTKTMIGVGKTAVGTLADMRIGLLGAAEGGNKLASGASRGAASLSRLAGSASVLAAATVGLELTWNALEQKVTDARTSVDDFFKSYNEKHNLAGSDNAFRELEKQIADTKALLDAAREDGKRANEEGILSGFFFGENGDPIGARINQENAEASQRQLDMLNKQREMALKISEVSGIGADAATKWIAQQARLGVTFENSDQALAAYNATVGINVGVTDQSTFSDQQKSQALGVLQSGYSELVGAAEAYTESQAAVLEASRDQARAAQGVTDANNRYQQSLRQATDAQRALTAAREDLNRALAGDPGDALGVDEARLSLERAQRRLSEGGFDDDLDRREAELSVRRAELSLADAEARGAERVEQAKDNLTSAEDRLKQAQDGVNQAQRDQLEAGQRVEDAQAKVQKAYSDSAGAVFDLDQKQAAFNQSLTNAPIGLYLQQLDALKAKYPEVGAALQDEIDRLLKLSGQPVTIDEKRTRFSEVNSRRALGGPVSAGSPYIVNEHGTSEVYDDGRGNQVFIPNRDGRIVPKVVGAGSSGNTVTIQQTIVSPNHYSTREELQKANRDAMISFSQL